MAFRQRDGNSCGVLVSSFFEYYLQFRSDQAQLALLKHGDIATPSKVEIANTRFDLLCRARREIGRNNS